MLLKDYYFFLAAIFFLPIQNLGLELGFMTLKLSQFFALMYIVVLLLQRKVKLTNTQLVTIILLVITFIFFFISAFFSIDIERSFILSFAFFLCLIFYISSCLFLNSTKNPLNLLKITFYFSGTICSIYGIFQLLLHFLGLGGNVNFNPWDVIPRVPYFSSENVHASFALIVCIFCVSDLLIYRKFRFIILSLINLAGLAATGTRGAMLSFIIVLLLLSFISLFDRRSSKLILLIFSLMSILLVYFFWDVLFLRFESLATGSDGTTNVRFEHYSIMLSYYMANPMWGIGLGGSQSLGYQDIHNLFLMVLCEGGAFAFVSYLFAFIILLYRSVKNSLGRVSVGGVTYLLVFLGVAIQALFEPSLYFFHLYISLALLSVDSKLVKNEKKMHI